MEENEQRDTLHFFYDAQSHPTKVNFNGAVYTYLHNLQGDIVGIVDNGGNLVVEYKYDAWGKPLSIIGSLASTLGRLNPFRYRAYIYDEETGFSYLRNRYYCSLIGRFLNADILLPQYGDISKHSLYVYCDNQPTKYVDNNGCRKNWAYLASTQPELKNAFSEEHPLLQSYHSILLGSGRNILESLYIFEPVVTDVADEFDLEPAMIYAVLYREMICLTPGEIIADPFKPDASLGIGQIKPSTAIEAERAVLGSCTVSEGAMKKKLMNPIQNIRYVAMNLRSILNKNTIIDAHLCKIRGDSRRIILAFARYNSTQWNARSKQYASSVYRYYQAFKRVLE